MFGILWTIATILIIIWICGFFIHALAATLGIGIHILLIVAIVLFVVGFISRGRTAA